MREKALIVAKKKDAFGPCLILIEGALAGAYEVVEQINAKITVRKETRKA